MVNKVILHLGIHKTATTHLQVFLDSVQEALAAAGVTYIPLAEFRETVTRQMHGNKAQASENLRQLVRKASSYESLVLSDENLIGAAREMKRGYLYEKSSRVRLLLEALPECDVRIVICLRNPVELLPSLYSEFLHHNPFLTFEAFATEENIRKIEYRRLFAWLSELPGSASVRVEAFEQAFGGGFDATLRAILKCLALDQTQETRLLDLYAGEGVSRNPGVARSALTEEEAEHLTRVADERGREAACDELRSLEQARKRFGENKFRPIESALATELEGSYRRDLEWARVLSASRTPS